jgi:hypothetical protein
MYGKTGLRPHFSFAQRTTAMEICKYSNATPNTTGPII